MIRKSFCTNAAQLDILNLHTQEMQQNADDSVRAILGEVKLRGDEAVLSYTERFDGVRPASLEVAASELDEAVASVDPELLAVFREAAENIRSFHEKQKRTGFILTEKPGVVLGQRVIPLDRVGVYVPGGTASYPSTVLMDIIPAKIAGVGEIIMVSPPGSDGKIAPAILAAAKTAGADRVFAMGGAQAVAALAYGTAGVPRVDKIVGPGNIFVATAKRMVYGLVDIDMIAGPSDVLVIADDSANPAHVAMDMLAQAEHDRLATAILVTISEQVADATAAYIEQYLEALPRCEIARHSIETNGRIIVTDTLERAADISNRIAPEHLEICIREPFSLLPRIRHAGSVFLGHYAPEALGDYFAGPNHTLPTGGTARFSSPLSVDDFCKKSSFLYYDKAALQNEADKVARFARSEGLDAHARSVTLRAGEGRL